MTSKRINRFTIVIDFTAIWLTLLVSNRGNWLCLPEESISPPSICEYSNIMPNLLVFLILVVLILSLLHFQGRLGVFWELWKSNWLLILFLAFCLISLLWSVNWSYTLFKWLLISSSAIVAAYLGMRYRNDEILSSLVLLGIAVVFMSYVFVLMIPSEAIMSGPGVAGNWRGAFSHKNYMGALIGYITALILYEFGTTGKKRLKIILGVTYFLALGLLWMSRSATGVILFLFLNGLVLLFFVHHFWASRMRRSNYVALGLGAAILVIAAALNWNALMGLLGRSSEMTGRVPLWGYVLSKLKVHDLWLGYGLGAPWTLPEFRVQAARDLGWPSLIVNGHNGYIDVLLYIGIVGFCLFVSLLVLTIARLAAAVRARGLDALMWLIITLVYVLIVNITISYFFEFELFHWVMLVYILFVMTPSTGRGIASSSDWKKHDVYKVLLAN